VNFETIRVQKSRKKGGFNAENLESLYTHLMKT